MTNWYTRKQKINNNLLWLGLNTYQEMYWSLSDDSSSPFSRISVANSSFSIDPTKWCPLNCSYCVTLSNNRDLNSEKLIEIEKNKNYKDLFSKNIKILFEGDILIENLYNFEWFIRDKSIISISTWSSDPFLKENQIQIEKIFLKLIDLNLKNPIWIVSKYWIPKGDILNMVSIFSKIIHNWNKVIISVSQSGLPVEIEPYQGNRFSWMNELKKIWVNISHHLRPIIRWINDNVENIEKNLFLSNGIVNSICIGWLRLDPSIILVWKYIKKLDENLLPNKPWEKDLPDDFYKKVQTILNKNKINIPIFFRSSEVISNSIWICDFNLYKYRKQINNLRYILSTNNEFDSDFFKKNKNNICDFINSQAEEIWIKKLNIYKNWNDFFTDIDLNYQWNRLLIHKIWHSWFFKF